MSDRRRMTKRKLEDDLEKAVEEEEIFSQEIDININEIEDENPFAGPWEDSDIVIHAKGVKFHLHKMVLGMNSKYFKAFFGTKGMIESATGEATLRDCNPAAFLNTMKSLYPEHEFDFGTITLDKLDDMLDICRVYMIDSLMRRIGNFTLVVADKFLLYPKPNQYEMVYELMKIADKYKFGETIYRCSTEKHLITHLQTFTDSLNNFSYKTKVKLASGVIRQELVDLQVKYNLTTKKCSKETTDKVRRLSNPAITNEFTNICNLLELIKH